MREKQAKRLVLLTGLTVWPPKAWGWHSGLP